MIQYSRWEIMNIEQRQVRLSSALNEIKGKAVLAIERMSTYSARLFERDQDAISKTYGIMTKIIEEARPEQGRKSATHQLCTFINYSHRSTDTNIELTFGRREHGSNIIAWMQWGKRLGFRHDRSRHGTQVECGIAARSRHARI